jgi:hypothetical protein
VLSIVLFLTHFLELKGKEHCKNTNNPLFNVKSEECHENIGDLQKKCYIIYINEQGG